MLTLSRKEYTSWFPEDKISQGPSREELPPNQRELAWLPRGLSQIFIIGPKRCSSLHPFEMAIVVKTTLTQFLLSWEDF